MNAQIVLFTNGDFITRSNIEKGSGPSIGDPLYMIRMPADCSFYTIYTFYTASSPHLHLYTARHLFV